MSIWCSCHGTIAMQEGSRLSIKKSVQNFFDEVVFADSKTEHRNGIVVTEFSFVFSEEGKKAATMIDTWLSEVVEHPFYVYSQVEAEIRFT